MSHAFDKHRECKIHLSPFAQKRPPQWEASFLYRVVKRIGSMNGQFLFQVFQILSEVFVGFAQIVDGATCV